MVNRKRAMKEVKTCIWLPKFLAIQDVYRASNGTCERIFYHIHTDVLVNGILLRSEKTGELEKGKEGG